MEYIVAESKQDIQEQILSIQEETPVTEPQKHKKNLLLGSS